MASNRFSCQTCQVNLDAQDMSKHLSSTRHKSIKIDEKDEIVQCEECEDSNIHQLLVLRFGLSDMALLCQLCLGKEEKPSTQYSLSNGSLIGRLSQYYQLRDIECDQCHGDKDLNVAKEGRELYTLCSPCLLANQDKLKGLKFVNENEDDFLFQLFGIKEFIPSKNLQRGRSRKVGRRGGKGMRKRGPKKVDPAAEERRAHYMNTKATSQAIKSGSTVLAVGTNDLSKKPKAPEKFSKNGSSSSKNIRGAKQPALKQPSRPTKTEKRPTPSNKDIKTSSKGNNSRPDPRSEKPPNDKKSSSPKPPTQVNNESKANVSKEPKGISSKDSKGSVSKGPANKGSTKKESKTPGVRAKGELVAMSEKLKKADAKDKKASKAESKTSVKQTNNEKKNESLPNGKSNGKQDNKGPKDKKTPLTKTQATKVDKKSELTPEPEEVVNKKLRQQLSKLGISQYTPSKDPPLSYDSLETYFEEMCYNLFLEEKIDARINHSSLIEPSDMSLEWYQDQDKKHKQYKANFLLTDEFIGRFVSKKMQALKKMPFSINQSMILIADNDIPWYGKIVTQDTRNASNKRGSRNLLKIMELVIELFDWNKQPLPTSININDLRILPCSIPASRVFYAMSRIQNPSFVKMLLGKEPIRQIVFRNYVQYSKTSLNDSQKVAIQSVLNNSITVLQGPPGTGKTSTIYEIILQLLENLNTFPILVVAASNIAIDNIAEKLLEKHGKSILRIVANEKEEEYNNRHPLGSICLHNKLYGMLSLSMQETIADLRKPFVKVSQNQYKKLIAKQIELTNILTAQAKVIFTTTVTAGGLKLNAIKRFPVVIMDESTQSSEPSTLIPLSMPGVDKFVMVGDQKQLSSFSQVPNLSLSLFERVLLNGTYKTPHMLDTQYRMHPKISAFPKLRFYDNKLKDGITAEDRKSEGVPENPVYFWDTCGRLHEDTIRVRFREDSGRTYVNRGEIQLVAEVLTHLIYQKGIKREDIGVITPYSGQRDLLSSTLVKNDLINPEKEEIKISIDSDDIETESKPNKIHSVSDIMIASIDAFQGREKNFLIMSCVRSNTLNKIGFLSDKRRLNVALTRAKYGLIIIGDVTCLSNGDSIWNDYLDSLKEENVVHQDEKFIY